MAELLTFLLLLLPPPSLLLLLLLDARVALKGQRPQAIDAGMDGGSARFGVANQSKLAVVNKYTEGAGPTVAVSNVLQYALDKRDVNRDH